MPDIHKTYSLDASVETVFEKWISNDTVVPPAVKMDIIPEVGGKYGLHCKLGEADWVMEGIFKEIILNEKLVYTWEWNKDGKESLVSVLFSEAEEGTRVEISHTGFADAEATAMHDSGWDSYIAGFKTFL